MTSPADLREALGSFATGVTIVSAIADTGEPVGITANSFTSVSLEPPLILVSLSRRLNCFEKLAFADAFAVNVLHAGQRELSDRFARPLADKWSETSVETGRLGTPLIAGRLAHFECTAHRRYDGGDHVLLLGKVEDFSWHAEAEPLLFYRSGYRALATA